MLTLRLEPPPTVGDWVALKNDEIIAVLPRRSLLRRRNAHGDGEQQLAANIDKVLLVCGLDRPVKDGRIQRGTAISRDAGAEPVVVLTKASRNGDIDVDPQQAANEVRAAHPGIDVIVTSVKEGIGIEEIRSIIGHDTVTLLGESGAGKSSIVNALLGDDVVTIGDVRESDSKGRHTTTTRELHLLPGGGVLIDSPGIRAVGLVADTDGVAETFVDVDEIASTCRFADCQHEGQPWLLSQSSRDNAQPCRFI
jgi:ribosome biogenesis GTPase